MRAILAIFYCSLVLAIVPFTQVAQVGAENSQLPFDPSKPYALVVGDGCRLFVFDGRQLFQFPTHTSVLLTQVRWRLDRAFALAVGKNSSYLKITDSNCDVYVEAIITPFPKTDSLEAGTVTND